MTIVSVVATMLQRMLAAHDERPFPPAFRCALLGGGPAPRPLLEECAALGIPVVQTYGLTEIGSQVATLAPEDALARLGSAGKPLYPNELRIGDGDIPPGAAGRDSGTRAGRHGGLRRAPRGHGRTRFAMVGCIPAILAIWTTMATSTCSIAAPT